MENVHAGASWGRWRRVRAAPQALLKKIRQKLRNDIKHQQERKKRTGREIEIDIAATERHIERIIGMIPQLESQGGCACEVVPPEFWTILEQGEPVAEKKPKNKGNRAKKAGTTKKYDIYKISEKIDAYPAYMPQIPVKGWLTHKAAIQRLGVKAGTLVKARCRADISNQCEVEGGFLACDAKGRVSYKNNSTGRIFFLEATINPKSRDFKSFHKMDS